MGSREGSGAEIEWQFDVHDLPPVRRWLDNAGSNGAAKVAFGRAATATHVDTYLDTADRRLDRAGFTVRIRRAAGGAAELTLKSLVSERSDALLVRRELSQALEGDFDPAAPGPVTDRVRALVGSRALKPLFELQTRRSAIPLSVDGAATGELALDDTVIRAAGAGKLLGRLRRIEVEVPEEALTPVGPLVEELQETFGLHPALLSKYEAALAASGSHRTEPETFGPTLIGVDATIGEVALAVLRRHFGTMLVKEPGTRLGDDPEDLHVMRVATRRLRAALALFADTIPAEATRLRPELAWIGRTVGAVRDLDVQIADVDRCVLDAPEADGAAFARVRAALERDRADARSELLLALDSPRYERLVIRFGRMLRARSGTRTPPAQVAAPDLLLRRQRQVRKWSKRARRSGDPADYHRLRIADKRFRYALEFLADVYPGETEALVRRAVVLQDVLGRYQDGHVARARLRQLAVDRADELGAEAVFATGGLAERHRAAMETARLQVEPAAERLRGKPWKRLRKRLLTV